jgi:hypothetical protein
MNFQKKYVQLFLGLIGFLVGMITYWFNAYNDLYVFGFHIYKILAFSSLIGAFVGMFLFSEKPLITSIIITTGILIGVIFRILFDILFIDASHHNLFPFEIMIIAIISFPITLIAAYLTNSIKKSRNS